MPDLQFLADMNISPLTVEQLRKLGWRIMRVSEVMDKKSKDAEILAYCRANDMILITQDLDFSMLLAVQGHTKPSIITLRIGNVHPNMVTVRIMEAVASVERELEEGAAVTVDEISVRYRFLPIKTD